MALSLNQLLSAPQVTRVISTIAVPQSRFQTVMGMRPGGPNTEQVSGHFFGYDIYDRTRNIATGRAPGVGPATIAPNVIGHVPVTIYRAHEKIPLLQERIFRTRPLGRDWGAANVDRRGQQYVTRQEEYLAQRFANNREFMISRMFRGSFQLLQSGDDWIPVDSGGTFTINYQLPAGNLGQLDMLGAGAIIGTTWSNAAADIIGNILSINAANEQLHGRPIRHAWISSVVLGYLLNNTGLKNAGGTANTVFETFAPDGYRTPDGMASTGFTVVFRAIPWLQWHIYDAGLSVNGTFTKFIDNTHAIFTPEITSDIMSMVEGSEIVAENVLDFGYEAFGLKAWTERKTQPPMWELLGVDNCLPILYVPSAVQYPTIVF